MDALSFLPDVLRAAAAAVELLRKALHLLRREPWTKREHRTIVIVVIVTNS